MLKPRRSGALSWLRRPSRVPRDGRTMLKKAQDRKKKTNLDGNQGIPKPLNPFSVLSISEIPEVAAQTSVSLGSKVEDRVSSMEQTQNMDKTRVEVFSNECEKCHKGVANELDSLDNVVVEVTKGEDAPSTPVHQTIGYPVDGNPVLQGQWPLVVNRKKNKPKVQP
jgi:hypothetical protein